MNDWTHDRHRTSGGKGFGDDTLALVTCRCEYCGCSFEIERGQINAGRGRFCTRKCFSESRRLQPGEAARRRSERSKEYWAKPENKERKKILAHESFKRNYNPEMEAEKRRAKAKEHLEYIRLYYSKPENKQHKVQYDRERRFRLQYGEEFSVCADLLDQIITEVRKLEPSNYERRKAKGIIYKYISGRRDPDQKSYRD